MKHLTWHHVGTPEVETADSVTCAPKAIVNFTNQYLCVTEMGYGNEKEKGMFKVIRRPSGDYFHFHWGP